MGNNIKQQLTLNLNDFLYDYEVRLHTEAQCTNVYVRDNGYPSVVIEFLLKEPKAIQEFGNTFNWILPSINQAVHRPYAYQLLFKSVTFDIPYDEEGNINLLDLKDRHFALSIEKKCFDNGEIVPRIVNLIAYSD